jgi:hypothetical protein
MREPLRRSDFSEAADGNCRMTSNLCSKLSQTAPTWGRLVAPWAEYVAHSLYSGRSTQGAIVKGLKTPLTQRHRREAKGGLAPQFRMPKTEHLCRGCGNPLRKEHEECSNCAVGSATGRLMSAGRIGRIAAQSSEARAKHSESARNHAIARASWKESDQPAWLTPSAVFEATFSRCENSHTGRGLLRLPDAPARPFYAVPMKASARENKPAS